jgi:uncharacterized protein YeaO (DUF488 family)
MPVKTKSVYEPKAKDDGCRVLVMRFWPRGVSKDKIDVWEKDLGAPPNLIKRWKKGSVTWQEFSKEYRKAAAQYSSKIKELRRRAAKETVTLLCGCKDAEHCHRTLLQKLISAKNK